MAVALGARNLGGAIVDHLQASGWSCATVTAGEETAASMRQRGAFGMVADASDPDALAGALAQVRDQLGAPSLIVNAVSASRPPDDGKGFGGGPLGEATLEGFRGWAAATALLATDVRPVAASATTPGVLIGPASAFPPSCLIRRSTSRA